MYFKTRRERTYVDVSTAWNQTRIRQISSKNCRLQLSMFYRAHQYVE